MKEDCLFCTIGANKTDTELIYESDSIVAFNDINPQAPTHIIIIPTKHISNVNEIEKSDIVLMGELIKVAKEIADDKDFADDGYRLVFNCGDDGGQEVDHIHLHLLAGRQLGWPPG